MLTQLEVFSEGISDPPLPIVDQNESMDMIQILNIDGLGPVKATVNTTQYGSIDGEFPTGSFTPKRNIVIDVGLNPDWSTQTIESLRQILYQYFTPKTDIRMRFTSTHLPVVEILGTVESCEPNMFAKDPQYQISIICPQPYFVAISATVMTGTTVAFSDTTETVINYEGSEPTGMVIDVTLPAGHANLISGELRFANKSPYEKIGIVSPVNVSDTQYLRISSVQGDKFVRQYSVPFGSYTSILEKWLPGSEWITLRRGKNRIQIFSSDPGLIWSLQYYAKFGGL